MRSQLAGIVLGLGSFLPATAQCQEWTRFHGAGPDQSVLCQFVFDDGSGPELYVGGFFTEIEGVLTAGVARWNGTRWQALGTGEIQGSYFGTPGVYDFAVFDDGTGPALYVAGDFDSIGGVAANNIAKWTGSTWQALGSQAANGTNMPVLSLESYDDGQGQKLYASGYFWTAGNVSAPGIARWTGTSWENFTGGTGILLIEDFLVFDDGSGPQLYACGSFPSIAGVQMKNVGRFDGSQWHALGAGTNNRTYALAVFDDGSGAGPQLYAAGAFWNAGFGLADLVARWDGANWHDLDGGLTGPGNLAETLTVYDDGTGAKLYVGGSFGHAGSSNNPVENLAAWDGTRWLTASELPGCDRLIFSLGTYDAGSGPRLIAGGVMAGAGDVAASHIASWNGAHWSPLVRGTGFDRTAFAFATHDDGHGPALYAGGDFLAAGPELAERIAKWTAADGWKALDPGSPGADESVHALLSWNEDGSGAAELFATGEFQEVGGVAASAIARWNGAQWSALGSGLSDGLSTGNALALYDDGSGVALYVAGAFLTAGGVPAQRIAKWDGANWSALGAGLGQKAHALATFDDGSGEKLYVGGQFPTAGAVFTPGIASWDGNAWSGVGGGADEPVLALTSFDDGSGTALFVGGAFTHVGNLAAARVARWDGSSWSALGAGFANGVVNELIALDAGDGMALYAGGTFTHSGGAPVAGVARWDGAQWQPLDAGVGGANASVDALGAFDDGLGFGANLWLGGTFTTAGDAPSPFLARWGRTCCPPQVYCPTAPTSQGCLSSISATGRASASASTGFTIDVAQVDGERSGILFYGTGGALSSPWGTSFLCVKAPTQRTGLQQAGGSSGNCDGAFQLDWNGYLATHPGALGTPFSAGDEVWMQAWYREPTSAKTTHMSDALHFQMCP